MKRLSAYGMYKDGSKGKNASLQNSGETSGKRKKQKNKKSIESFLESGDSLPKETPILATPLKSHPMMDINSKDRGNRRSSIRKEIKNLMSRSKKGRQSVDAFLQSPLPLKLSGKKASKKLKKLTATNFEDQTMTRSSSESSFTVKRRRRSKSLERISKNLSGGINGSSDHLVEAETGNSLTFVTKDSSGKKSLKSRGDALLDDDDMVFVNGNTESVLFNNDDDDEDDDDDDSISDDDDEEDLKNGAKSGKRKLPAKSLSTVKKSKNKNINDPRLIVESPPTEDAGFGVDGRGTARKSGKSKSPQPPHMNGSLRDSAELLDHIIKPVSAAKFFKDVWEKKPLFIRRHNSLHNDGWFSTAELDRILRQHRVNYTENLDVVSYSGGERETHNPVGRAHPAVVWDYYNNGCSVRLLNPQTYNDEVWRRLALLQEYFGCVAGANIYLTPPGTQGFAPHYDDIEAFVLQLEGKKHWRVYEPRNSSEVLPRFSSGNFTDADLPDPVLDIVLEPGDLLYFPRGFIHQGTAVEDTHSLHITVSVGQRSTYADLLERLIPRALEAAVEEEVDFRRSLPRDCFTYMGVAYSDNMTLGTKRAEFLKMIDKLMDRLKAYAPVDAAVDQAAKKFLEDSLPPCLSNEEKQCSVMSSDTGARWDSSSNSVTNCTALAADTEIRVVRQHSIRLVSEENGVSIYHNVENSRLYHECSSKNLEVDAEMAEAVEFILNSYPHYVSVDNLPLDSLEKQVALAADLFERGLLLTRKPLDPALED